MPAATVLVTGGAGYVGSALVPKLLAGGYRVKVLDLYLFGDDVLDAVKGHPYLEQIKGDIRDQELLRRALPGSDAVIHLACISNDPRFVLKPASGRWYSSARPRAYGVSSMPRRAVCTASATPRTSRRTIRLCRSRITTSTKGCASRSCSRSSRRNSPRW